LYEKVISIITDNFDIVWRRVGTNHHGKTSTACCERKFSGEVSGYQACAVEIQGGQEL
jgi:hypothetical protein